MTVVTSEFSIFFLLIIFGSSIPSISSSKSKSSIREEYLLPLVQQIKTAEDAHAADQPEVVLQSLRSVFTDFKQNFGDENPEAISVLSSILLGEDSEKMKPPPFFQGQPDLKFKITTPSVNSTQLGHLMFETAKEIFGSTHLYSLTILQRLAIRLFNQGEKDKSLQVHRALCQILKDQLDLTESGSNSNDEGHDQGQEAEIQLLLTTLDNLSMLYLISFNWRGVLDVRKEIYKLHNSHPHRPSFAKDVQEALANIVQVHSVLLTQGVMAQEYNLFQLVQHTFHLPSLPLEETSLIVQAYETADRVTSPSPTHAFPLFLEYLTTKPDGKWDLKTVGTIPLKYEEEVYEHLFVIMRLLIASARLRGRNPEYEEYRTKLLTMTGKSGEDYRTNGLSYSFVEGISVPFAKAQKADAVNRAKDILKRAEKKYGKNSEKAKGSAEIIASLYSQAGMDKEAQEIRKDFEIPVTKYADFLETRNEL